MRHFFVQINKKQKHSGKTTNRILLDLMDYGDKVPTSEDFSDFPLHVWMDKVNRVTLHEDKFYDYKKFSEIHLPVRIKNKWVMLVCDPKIRSYQVVMFDEWDWNDPAVSRALVLLAFKLRNLVISAQLMLPGPI
jgi:hypothetical protein